MAREAGPAKTEISLGAEEIARALTIQRKLLMWYRQFGRSLPFRGSRDPYRIWVSEIMLQQTRAETVGPYYERFMALFPDVRALANADEIMVLKAWEGLGYYSRARNLHKSARLVTQEHGGLFPDNADELLKLPGVGPYTAAAIASIAYDAPIPAMDGNLQRVISRLFRVEEDIGIPSVKRRLHTLGHALMPAEGAGDMNQALMDLGATVCLPGTPDCAGCPLKDDCLALAGGEPERLPNMQRKSPPREVSMQVLLLTCGGRILVSRREQALLRGLYVFVLLEDGEAPPRALARHLRGTGLNTMGRAKHIFTHRVWQMDILGGELATAPDIPEHRWVTRLELEALPMPTAMKAARALAVELLKE